MDAKETKVTKVNKNYEILERNSKNFGRFGRYGGRKVVRGAMLRCDTLVFKAQTRKQALFLFFFIYCIMYVGIFLILNGWIKM